MVAMPTRTDVGIASWFLTFVLAALARHNQLPKLPRLGLWRGGSGWSPSSIGPPPQSQAPILNEGDLFHLPLAALRHGLADALAWNDALACNTPPPGTNPPPEFLKAAKASFFFGESNGTTFASLRGLYGLSNRDYLSSFETGFEVFSSNSKSRQFFCFTRDKRFIIKTMSSEEIRALTAILGDYRDHLMRNPKSLLVHYCGHYHVRLYRYETDEWEDLHFLVMRNLMNEPRPGMSVGELYDVKGSTVGRAASEKDKAKDTKILKDLDLIQRPVSIVFGRQREAFMQQTFRDVDFLRSKGVMDYSLLLGIIHHHRHPSHPSSVDRHHQDGFPQRFLSYFFGPAPGTRGYLPTSGQGASAQEGWIIDHPQGQETYVTGIIDILQLYNRRKQAETMLKSVVYKRKEISAVDPSLYASRFMGFLDRVVLKDPLSAGHAAGLPPPAVAAYGYPSNAMQPQQQQPQPQQQGGGGGWRSWASSSSSSGKRGAAGA